jgi:hypothetical protein
MSENTKETPPVSFLNLEFIKSGGFATVQEAITVVDLIVDLHHNPFPEFPVTFPSSGPFI